jgi:predicted ATPase
MIEHVVGNKLLPANVRKDIIERTDGIPLFVEEMTKAVLEAGSEPEAMQTAAAVPSSALAVPPSLHASLMARLDRLGSAAKEVAQIGAAIGREFSHALLAFVVRKGEAELASSLDRLNRAGLLFRKGVPPHATYLFKHALVQEAAYGTLLRQPRRALHARIAETLENQFAEVADNQAELLARHWTEAGQIEKGAGLWGKAGQRSLERSALVEAVAQLARALDQIASLPGTPALRREQIKLSVAIITPLQHVKGNASPEANAAAERARLLIEQAEALGEPPEDPLLSFAVLYSLWTSNYVGSNGDVTRELAAQFLALAEKQGTTAALLTAHRMMGITAIYAGEFERGRAHFDKGIVLYRDSEHRPLAGRFGADARVSILSFRSLALWFLGYPEAALADTDLAIKDAREIGQPATLMHALAHATRGYFQLGHYAKATAAADELDPLAEEKGFLHWKPPVTSYRGLLSAVTGKPSDAVHMITSVIVARRSMGSDLWLPMHLSYLARAHAELDQFDDAWRCIGEAIEAMAATGERWWEAEVYRIAGEVALTSPERDRTRAEACFERALNIARAQQAKSWELLAVMSMARLWRDQGRRQQARELLAPVYGWFTEGFDTLDLRHAKALLDELAR